MAGWGRCANYDKLDENRKNYICSRLHNHLPFAFVTVATVRFREIGKKAVQETEYTFIACLYAGSCRAEKDFTGMIKHKLIKLQPRIRAK